MNVNFMGLILLGNALLASIIAIILSAKGRKNPAGRGMGTAGLIIGIITLTLILFGFLFSAFVWPGFLIGSAPVATTYPASVEAVDATERVEETISVENSVVEEATEWVEDWAEAVTEAAPEAATEAAE